MVCPTVSAMNRVIFIGSLVGVVLFSVVLLLTFIAQHRIKDFARGYINQRIEPGLTQGVVVVEREVLPLLAKQPEAALKVTEEIARYRADPQAYIDAITSGRMTQQTDGGWLTKATGSLKESAKQQVSLPQMVGDHFRRVFDHLVLDLRIFSVTNVLAFIVVALLMRGYDARSPRLVVQAFIPFLATGYATTVYIKQDWFFNLLLDYHMGVIYPLLLIMTALDLWNRWQRGQLRKRASQLAHEMFLH